MTNENANRLNFKELKKELRDIDKIGKENQDVPTWETELKMWKNFQAIEDPKIIYFACLLTSHGEAQRLIEEMKDNLEEADADEDSEEEEETNSENEEGSEESYNEGKYPTLEDISKKLKEFYGITEDQNTLLREIRNMKIKRNEKVKDFNIKYRSLYTKLDKKRRRWISVLDYADSLRNNYEAWKRVSLKGDNISLEKAYALAEKVDRLTPSTEENNSRYGTSSFNRDPVNNRKIIQKFENKGKPSRTNVDADSIAQQMNNLSLKTCFFCKEKGHYQSDCPKLKEIVENNKKEIFTKKPLN